MKSSWIRVNPIPMRSVLVREENGRRQVTERPREGGRDWSHGAPG